MEAILPRSWREEFAHAAAIKREDILYKERMAQFETTLRQRREIEAGTLRKKEREETERAWLMTASSERVIAFRQRLDRHDASNVEALIENRKLLDKVQDMRRELFENAYRLEDGRRVFKHEDGVRVFDEFRQEVPRDVIDPNLIPDHLPRMGRFIAVDDLEKALKDDRQKMIVQQNRIGQARDEADQGGITNGRLDDLESELEAAQPDSARHRRAIEALDAKPVTFAEDGAQLTAQDRTFRQAESVPRMPWP